MSAVDELDMACSPAIAIMPLGTGNDFARAMRWGGGASGPVTKRMARRWLLSVADAHGTPELACPSGPVPPYTTRSN